MIFTFSLTVSDATAAVHSVSSLVTSLSNNPPSIRITCDVPTTWADWWEYDKNSDRGPDHWGIVNRDWRICRDGKFQSPVDIPPHKVKFDPLLAQSLLYVSGTNSVYGNLENTGQELQFKLDERQSGIVSLDGGPLSYSYRLSHIKLRYGTGETHGSEHSVDGFYFAAELQLFFYNDNLYLSYDQALGKAHGIAAVTVFIQESDNETNSEFQRLFHGLNKVGFKGEKKQVEGVSVRDLLPLTHHYITYQGSLTAPPCSEGVTWILYNRPINIPRWQIRNLRSKISRNKPPPEGTAPREAERTRLPMMGNTRPLQQRGGRGMHLWTNVRSRLEGGQGPAACAYGVGDPSIMKYSMNTLYSPTISNPEYQQEQTSSSASQSEPSNSVVQSQASNNDFQTLHFNPIPIETDNGG
ncbi:carbonic anhydrase-related protein 10-like [Symsagittifera roscoffensis]|uniref:carbonic anhydrase-related protein 10-like n=1 Tax=Symsagittifera roscoffensis TaxID=84072 RepID=UPI00307C38ED